jgi:HK97 family phage major capsid protein
MGFAWMAHDNTILALHKLKDGAGRPLLHAGMAEGDPWRLLNAPLFSNPHMASTISSGTRSLIAGALPKYRIRNVAELRIRRLDERFSDADQIAFVAFHRCDGLLLDAGSHPVCALQH